MSVESTNEDGRQPALGAGRDDLRSVGRFQRRPLVAAMPGNDDGRERRPEDHRDYLRLLAAIQMPPELRRTLDASDIVQGTMLNALANIDQCRAQTDAQFCAWLRTILKNIIIDELGKRGHEPSIASVEQSSQRLDTVLGDERSSVGEQAERNKELQRMAALLHSLPERQYQAIVLKHICGWRVAEIAEVLDCTQPSVAGLLQHGLKSMRECVREE